MQHYTFSNRLAASGSDLKALCVCLYVNILTHVCFPCAKSLSVNARGKANISMIHFVVLHFLFIHPSIHPRKRLHPRAVIPFPSYQFLFLSLLSNAGLAEACTGSKTQLSTILPWQKQKEGRKEAVHAVIHCSAAYALYSLHATLLPSLNHSLVHTVAVRNWAAT